MHTLPAKSGPALARRLRLPGFWPVSDVDSELRRVFIAGHERERQPTLFESRGGHRPAGERNAVERYQAPSLFSILDGAG